MKKEIKKLLVSGSGKYEFTENEIISNIDFLHEIQNNALRLYNKTETNIIISNNSQTIHFNNSSIGTINHTRGNIQIIDQINNSKEKTSGTINLAHGNIHITNQYNGEEKTSESQNSEKNKEKGKTLNIQDFNFKLSTINISGAAALKINGKFFTDKLDILANGSSELSIKNIKLTDFTANNSGSSELRIKDAEIASVTANASGASELCFKDSTIGEIDIIGSGASEIKGKNTKVGKITKILSGTSEVKFTN